MATASTMPKPKVTAVLDCGYLIVNKVEKVSEIKKL
jgi:hypothetical protein